ncbi:Dynein heavy chain 3, axonemal [Bonamia ostreae]|uniref:Dynein heavy chain 3, axonemal n=1 Tax=Bonamia ostreae TaxID=126728 RepID=A0ABV2AS45_9EUKA
MSKNGESTFKIVIATDNHLGCYSNDAIRSDDSFATFEEVLKQSVAEQADFLLLGGDLFHHNRPSQPTVHRCLRLLKKYCLGSREVGFEVVSDQSFNFAEKRANFEDPNLKISLPIFSIHGNHDDPTGIENLSVMDIMSTANFVNYFGKAVDISKINIKPVLMRKGRTKLAVYGLGSIKDERLHRLFLDRKVKFSRPAEDKEDWFNIFVIHQNRFIDLLKQVQAFFQ